MENDSNISKGEQKVDVKPANNDLDDLFKEDLGHGIDDSLDDILQPAASEEKGVNVKCKPSKKVKRRVSVKKRTSAILDKKNPDQAVTSQGNAQSQILPLKEENGAEIVLPINSTSIKEDDSTELLTNNDGIDQDTQDNTNGQKMPPLVEEQNISPPQNEIKGLDDLYKEGLVKATDGSLDDIQVPAVTDDKDGNVIPDKSKKVKRRVSLNMKKRISKLFDENSTDDVPSQIQEKGNAKSSLADIKNGPELPLATETESEKLVHTSQTRNTDKTSNMPKVTPEQTPVTDDKKSDNLFDLSAEQTVDDSLDDILRPDINGKEELKGTATPKKVKRKISMKVKKRISKLFDEDNTDSFSSQMQEKESNGYSLAPKNLEPQEKEIDVLSLKENNEATQSLEKVKYEKSDTSTQSNRTALSSSSNVMVDAENKKVDDLFDVSSGNAADESLDDILSPSASEDSKTTVSESKKVKRRISLKLKKRISKLFDEDNTDPFASQQQEKKNADPSPSKESAEPAPKDISDDHVAPLRGEKESDKLVPPSKKSNLDQIGHTLPEVKPQAEPVLNDIKDSLDVNSGQAVDESLDNILSSSGNVDDGKDTCATSKKVKRRLSLKMKNRISKMFGEDNVDPVPAGPEGKASIETSPKEINTQITATTDDTEQLLTYSHNHKQTEPTVKESDLDASKPQENRAEVSGMIEDVNKESTEIGIQGKGKDLDDLFQANSTNDADDSLDDMLGRVFDNKKEEALAPKLSKKVKRRVSMKKKKRVSNLFDEENVDPFSSPPQESEEIDPVPSSKVNGSNKVVLSNDKRVAGQLETTEYESDHSLPNSKESETDTGHHDISLRKETDVHGDETLPDQGRPVVQENVNEELESFLKDIETAEDSSELQEFGTYSIISGLTEEEEKSNEAVPSAQKNLNEQTLDPLQEDLKGKSEQDFCQIEAQVSPPGDENKELDDLFVVDVGHTKDDSLEDILRPGVKDDKSSFKKSKKVKRRISVKKRISDIFDEDDDYDPFASPSGDSKQMAPPSSDDQNDPEIVSGTKESDDTSMNDHNLDEGLDTLLESQPRGSSPHTIDVSTDVVTEDSEQFLDEIKEGETCGISNCSPTGDILENEESEVQFAEENILDDTSVEVNDIFPTRDANYSVQPLNTDSTSFDDLFGPDVNEIKEMDSKLDKEPELFSQNNAYTEESNELDPDESNIDKLETTEDLQPEAESANPKLTNNEVLQSEDGITEELELTNDEQVKPLMNSDDNLDSVLLDQPEEVVDQLEEKVEDQPEEVVDQTEEVVDQPEEVVDQPEEVVDQPEEVVDQPEEEVLSSNDKDSPKELSVTDDSFSESFEPCDSKHLPSDKQTEIQDIGQKVGLELNPTQLAEYPTTAFPWNQHILDLDLAKHKACVPSTRYITYLH